MQTNTVIQDVAKEAITMNNIISYLDLIKNNLHLSVLNQCMVYIQKPTASNVCGRKAWENMNRTVKENAKPIVLYFPSIKLVELPEEFKVDGIPQCVGDTDAPMYTKEPVFENNFIPVNAFDFEATNGDDLPEINKDVSFADIIIDITGATPEFVDKRALRMKKGEYDKESNTFRIAELDINTPYGKEEYNKVLLDLYIDYTFDNYNLNDISLKSAVKYVIYEHFNINHNIEKPVFKRLDKKTTNQKISFLVALQFLTSGIVQDFEGYILNFDDTAIVNNLLTTSEPKELWVLFDKAIETISDDFLKDEIYTLKNRLIRTNPGYLDDLAVLRAEQKIYTFPPKQMLLDKTDYLRQDRVTFLNNHLR